MKLIQCMADHRSPVLVLVALRGSACDQLAQGSWFQFCFDVASGGTVAEPLLEDRIRFLHQQGMDTRRLMALRIKKD